MKTIEVKPGGRHIVYDAAFHKDNPHLPVYEDGILLVAKKRRPPRKKRETLSLKKTKKR